jgi:hypothetical protein
MSEYGNLSLRILHPEKDERFFREAWRWKESYPRLIRKWDYIAHFRQWFALMKRRVTIGVFSDHLWALVTFRPEGKRFEIHIDCERGADRNELLIALLNIEAVVVREWKPAEIFGGVISRNRGIFSVAQACGLERDGVEEQVGRLRWVRVSKKYEYAS